MSPTPCPCPLCQLTDQHDEQCPRLDSNWRATAKESLVDVKTCRELPSPVLPSVAFEKHPPPASVIDQINDVLQKPWGSYDRAVGKSIATSLVGQHYNVEFVMEYYRTAGWEVELADDQRDGAFLKFKPKKDPKR